MKEERKDTHQLNCPHCGKPVIVTARYEVQKVIVHRSVGIRKPKKEDDD